MVACHFVLFDGNRGVGILSINSIFGTACNVPSCKCHCKIVNHSNEFNNNNNRMLNELAFVLSARFYDQNYRRHCRRRRCRRQKPFQIQSFSSIYVRPNDLTIKHPIELWHSKEFWVFFFWSRGGNGTNTEFRLVMRSFSWLNRRSIPIGSVSAGLNFIDKVNELWLGPFHASCRLLWRRWNFSFWIVSNFQFGMMKSIARDSFEWTICLNRLLPTTAAPSPNHPQAIVKRQK